MQMHEHENPTEDEIIDDVLGEHPRAEELRLMRSALEMRRDAFRRELQTETDAKQRSTLTARLRSLNRQIKALLQEEGITEFVENSVRVTLTKAALEEEG